VAAIFLVTGLVSVWDVIAHYNGAIRLSMTLLGIPIFFGLRRLSKGWRTCALAIIWVAMLFTVVMLVFTFFVKAAGEVSVFGVKLGNLSTVETVLFCLALFLFYFWQYRVLTSDRVRALFYRERSVASRIGTHAGSL
jgi:hypothetical protein